MQPAARLHCSEIKTVGSCSTNRNVGWFELSQLRIKIHYQEKILGHIKN